MILSDQLLASVTLHGTEWIFLAFYTMSNEHLQNIDEQLNQGVIPPKETVRNILRWFGASRRGYNVVRHIRSQLEKFNLVTTPDFEFTYIDAQVQFGRPGQYEDIGPHTADPIYRIGRLESANRRPVCVKPDALLSQAITLMLTNDYSQLPVMTTSLVQKSFESQVSVVSS